MPSRLRKALRNIKPENDYLWRVVTDWNGEQTVVGDPVPDDLREDKIKLGTLLAARIVMVKRPDEDHSAPDREIVTEAESEPVQEPAEEKAEAEEEPAEAEDSSADQSDTEAEVTSEDVKEGDASVTGEVDWQSLSYLEKDKLAREHGYDGNRLKAVELNEWLETNLPKG